MSIKLEPGALAPDFSLPTADGGNFTLSSYLGQKVIVFFYPAAMTPGCTKEACDFRDAETALLEAGYVIVGVSPDKVEKLAKFAERDNLPYPLASDADKSVLEAYGAYGEKKLYGKLTRGVIRSTFVVDEEGIILHALYNVKATGHVKRILDLLEV